VERLANPIYVAATHQHVGKTTTCLAIISGLKKRFPTSIGYLKPVGQQHVPVYSESLGKEIQVDKDVLLIREHFKLQHLDYRYMSPVLIPKGYTKDYIDGKISHDMQLQAIVSAVNNISKDNEVILCEGTGHCAVGSIVGASNAKVWILM
jgi:dethiobiotin synthetase